MKSAASVFKLHKIYVLPRMKGRAGNSDRSYMPFAQKEQPSSNIAITGQDVLRETWIYRDEEDINIGNGFFMNALYFMEKQIEQE